MLRIMMGKRVWILLVEKATLLGGKSGNRMREKGCQSREPEKMSDFHENF
jgi:hypothetical protein